MARIAFRNHFKIGSVAKCNKRHISWDFQPVSLAISSGNVGLITYGDDTLISGKKHDLKNESWKREPNAKPVTITQYGIYIYIRHLFLLLRNQPLQSPIPAGYPLLF